MVHQDTLEKIHFSGFIYTWRLSIIVVECLMSISDATLTNHKLKYEHLHSYVGLIDHLTGTEAANLNKWLIYRGVIKNICIFI